MVPWTFKFLIVVPRIILLSISISRSIRTDNIISIVILPIRVLLLLSMDTVIVASPFCNYCCLWLYLLYIIDISIIIIIKIIILLLLLLLLILYMDN